MSDYWKDAFAEEKEVLCFPAAPKDIISNRSYLVTYCSGFRCRRQQKQHAAVPPPTRVRRKMERIRQKPEGRDKGSLTEQQTKGTGTTIQKKGIHKTNPQNRARSLEPHRHCALPSRE